MSWRHRALVDSLRQLPDHEEAPSTFPAGGATVASHLEPLLDGIFSAGLPVRFRFWDGSALGPKNDLGEVVFRSSRSLTRLIWSPDELGVARSFVASDIDLDGDIFALLGALSRGAGHFGRLGPRALARALSAAGHLQAIRRPPPRPDEEIRLGGRRHSRKRDACAIGHHYDVGNDFYRLVLGPAMTYSCARFNQAEMSLDDAQSSKHELVCRKLGLHERFNARLLDVGCGWGSMAMHAASVHGVHVLGITLSRSQMELAERRVGESGLEHLVEIRQADYRDLAGERFDAISSIGMFEHVGREQMDKYFATLVGLLGPQGRLLNHAISAPGGSRLPRRSFMNRYVFPDGELIDIAEAVAAMERAGLEVRDVESLREHYSSTLHRWIDNLECSWPDAVALVGEPRARVWRLYMAASANGFDDGGLAIHQALGVLPSEGGTSGMPRTRAGWE